jgi:hypothetical protein
MPMVTLYSSVSVCQCLFSSIVSDLFFGSAQYFVTNIKSICQSFFFFSSSIQL